MIRHLPINRPCLLATLAGCACCFATLAVASEGPYLLSEPANATTIESVEIRVNISGTAEFAIEKGKSLSHPLAADAVLKYRERRLPGSGRDAEALRSLRHYDSLETRISIADHVTSSRLDNDRRLVVAEGRREGVLLYSPSGPLTAADLELLRAPGDTLCLLGLLPPKAVAVGEKWSPGSWVGQMLTDIEAASQSDLSCTLQSVTDGKAKVTFEGNMVGATAASSATVKIQGWYVFDLKRQRLAQAEIEQTEKRSVGPISPGMNVTAKAIVSRTPTDDANGITEEAAAAVPLEPPAALIQLRFRAPWNVEFNHDRDWHIFQQSAQIGVLRLLEKGVFVAQCNLSPVRPAAPGEHVAEKQFEDDIRASIGPRLKSLKKGEVIPTDDGRFLYRVTAVGESNNVPVTWIYYLCAAPNGSQVSFVFAVETALLDRLGNRDRQMLNSLRFLPPPKEPERAETPKGSLR